MSHVLDNVVNMGNLSTSIDNFLSGLFDYRVGCVGVLKIDDGGLLLVDGESAGKDGEKGNKLREDFHVGGL